LEGFVRSKIICTIGPSSRSPETLRALKEAGMDVARVNLSHGTFNEHRLLFKDLRKLEKVAVLFDLPGPKMRLGEFTAPVTLESGAKIVFTVDEVKGSSKLIPVNYEKLPAEVTSGGQLFINDGLIEVKVTSVHRNLRRRDQQP
jgi:pyruvate kinase